MRRGNREARFLEPKQRMPRDLEQIERIRNARAPKPLTQHPYETIAANRYLPARQLVWPALLQGPDFDQERYAIDDLMSLRSTTYDNQAFEHFRIAQEIDGHVTAMQAKLKPFSKSVRSGYYTQAERFLDNLAGEMYEPVTPAGYVEPGAHARVAAR
jgi:hypothetical protein